MDKVFSNLMDIMHRTKAIDEKDGKSPIKLDKVPKSQEQKIEPKAPPVVEEEPKKAPAKKSATKKSTTTKKTSTKPATKKSTTAKKSTKKTATKKSTAKKSTTKSAKPNGMTDIMSKLKNINNNQPEDKKVVKEDKVDAKKTIKVEGKEEAKKTRPSKPAKIPVPDKPDIDLSNPENVKLMEALKGTLFAGGTDVSEYIEVDESKKQQAETLEQIREMRKEAKEDREDLREQQAYERLFTGTLSDDWQIENNDQIEEVDESEQSTPKIIQEDRNVDIKVDDDIQSKISEYYKRKAEKIEQEKLQEENYEEPTREYDRRGNDYEEIFGGEMVSRDELLGIDRSEEKKESEEPENRTYKTWSADGGWKRESHEAETVNATDEDYASIWNRNLSSESEVNEEDNNIEGYEQERNEMTGINEYNDLEEVREIVQSDGIMPATAEDLQTTLVEEIVNGVDDESPLPDVIELGNGEDYSQALVDEAIEGAYTEDEESQEDMEDKIYNLSEESDLSDYIVSSNVPVEEKRESAYGEEDNEIFVDSSMFNTSLNIYGDTPVDVVDGSYTEQEIEEEEEVQEATEDEVIETPSEDIEEADAEAEDDTQEVEETQEEEEESISKEEFYNEMARLQENLIKELKGEPTTPPAMETPATNQEEVVKTEEVKPQEEVPVEADKNETSESQPVEEKQQEIEDKVESTIPSDDDKASKLVEDILNNFRVKAELEESLGGEGVEETHEETEEIELNLLNKEVALNESDLEYQEQSEKPKEITKDDCFYLSHEDNEKKAVIEDEYLNMYNREMEGVTEKEVGDINFNKSIGNAVPSSQILKEQLESDKNEKILEKDNIEAIYTLFGMERKKKTKEVKEDLKVLYIASECQPFMATGGLADVAGSLPKAIAKIGGVDIRVIMPLYGDIKSEYREKFEYLGNFTVHLSWRQEYCGLFRYHSEGVTYYFVDNERYFKRNKAYGFYDDGERFAYFCKAIVEALPHLNFFPDIMHCNDWQTSLVSTYIKTGNWSDYRYYKIKHIYTIHNVEYQGVYGMENLKDLFGIDTRFTRDMEYNGDINLTKAAIQYSDKFTTVSDSYCDNLKQPYCSRGLHHIILRNEYKLSGIVNGVDLDFYNPMTDTALFKNYDINSIENKVYNKKIWQEELGLPVDGDTPMLAIVSRLVSHKGLDLVNKMIEGVLQAHDIQLIVVGTGDQRFVDYFKYLEEKYPTKVRAMVDKYSNDLARKAYGASDIFLMPSKIEPCGISQMISSIYGSVPIVREVGGLKDTITDFGCEGGGNGYTFTNYNPQDLTYQVVRAINDYKNKSAWREKMKICMSVDFSWDKSARKYIELYNSVMN